MLYLFTTALHTGLLGALLTFSNQVWYPIYAATTIPWGLTPLQDQQLGGLIMWIPAGLIYVGAALWILAHRSRAWTMKPTMMAAVTSVHVHSRRVLSCQ